MKLINPENKLYYFYKILLIKRSSLFHQSKNVNNKKTRKQNQPLNNYNKEKKHYLNQDSYFLIPIVSDCLLNDEIGPGL